MADKRDRMDGNERFRQILHNGNPTVLSNLFSELGEREALKLVDECYRDEPETALIHCVKRAGSGSHKKDMDFMACAEILLEYGLDVNDTDSGKKTALHWAAGQKNEALVRFLLDSEADPCLQDVEGRTSLQDALLTGNVEIVQLLLSADPNLVNKADGRGSPPLLVAVQKADEEVVKLLIEAGADLKAKEENSQRTALHYALYFKKQNIFNMLLDHGSDVTQTDHRGTNIVHRSCAVSEPSFLRTLLDKPNDELNQALRAEDSEGASPVIVACQNGYIQQLSMLLENGAKVDTVDRFNRCALHHCVENPSTECADLLLKTKPDLVDNVDDEGLTPLHMAVIAGNSALVELLLNKGASLKALDKERHSMAHWATVCGHVDVLDTLLTHGAEVTSPDKYQAYPIHYAAQMMTKAGLHSKNHGGEGNAGILKTLLKKKVSTEVEDKDKRTPIIWAASAGSSEACKVLYHHGADVNKADKDHLTAMHCAASRGHSACVDTLASHCKASVDPIDKNKCTPLFYATTLGHQQCMSTLLDLEADVNHTDTRGRTAAHCATVSGSTEVLEILRRRKVNLWARNLKGDLPLHEAAQYGHLDVIQYLLRQSEEKEVVNSGNYDGRTCLHIAALTNNVWLCRLLLDKGANVDAIMANKGKYYSPYDAALVKGNTDAKDVILAHKGRPGSAVTGHAAKSIQYRYRYYRKGRALSARSHKSIKSNTSRPKSAKSDARKEDVKDEEKDVVKKEEKKDETKDNHADEVDSKKVKDGDNQKDRQAPKELDIEGNDQARQVEASGSSPTHRSPLPMVEPIAEPKEIEKHSKDKSEQTKSPSPGVKGKNSPKQTASDLSSKSPEHKKPRKEESTKTQNTSSSTPKRSTPVINREYVDVSTQVTPVRKKPQYKDRDQQTIDLKADGKSSQKVEQNCSKTENKSQPDKKNIDNNKVISKKPKRKKRNLSLSSDSSSSDSDSSSNRSLSAGHAPDIESNDSEDGHPSRTRDKPEKQKKSLSKTQYKQTSRHKVGYQKREAPKNFSSTSSENAVLSKTSDVERVKSWKTDNKVSQTKTLKKESKKSGHETGSSSRTVASSSIEKSDQQEKSRNKHKSQTDNDMGYTDVEDMADNEGQGNVANGETPRRKKVQTNKLIHDIQESVRRYEKERRSIRQLHQIRRTQIYIGPRCDSLLFRKIVENVTSKDEVDQTSGSHDYNNAVMADNWRDYYHEQIRLMQEERQPSQTHRPSTSPARGQTISTDLETDRRSNKQENRDQNPAQNKPTEVSNKPQGDKSSQQNKSSRQISPVRARTAIGCRKSRFDQSNTTNRKQEQSSNSSSRTGSHSRENERKNGALSIVNNNNSGRNNSNNNNNRVGSSSNKTTISFSSNIQNGRAKTAKVHSQNEKQEEEDSLRWSSSREAIRRRQEEVQRQLLKAYKPVIGSDVFTPRSQRPTTATRPMSTVSNKTSSSVQTGMTNRSSRPATGQSVSIMTAYGTRRMRLVPESPRSTDSKDAPETKTDKKKS